jgi:hypothetical protein
MSGGAMLFTRLSTDYAFRGGAKRKSLIISAFAMLLR